MSGEPRLALLRFKGVPTADRETCTHEVTQICNNVCTFDEIQDLMAYYGCKLDDLVKRIVQDLRGTTTKRKG